MTDSHRMELENAYTRDVIRAILNNKDGMKREDLFNKAQAVGCSRTRFNLAMTHLKANKVIWCVGKEWEIRTETVRKL